MTQFRTLLAFCFNPRRGAHCPAGGFTLVEALISVSIIGIIATMTIPTILVQTQDSSSIVRVKAHCQRVMEAASRYENVQPDDDAPTGEEILQFTNFTVRNVDGATTLTGQTMVCNTDFPCYRYGDGAWVQTNATQPNRDRYTYFNVDPDGDGPRLPLTMAYDHAVGRLTSYSSLIADAEVPVPPQGFTANTTDPDYALKWTTAAN